MKTKKEQLIDDLVDAGYEHVVIFENPSYYSAFVGVTVDDRAVYDFEKMVEYLERDGMSRIDAVEFIEYNTIRALPYVENAPVIVYKIGQGERK